MSYMDLNALLMPKVQPRPDLAGTPATLAALMEVHPIAAQYLMRPDRPHVNYRDQTMMANNTHIRLLNAYLALPVFSVRYCEVACLWNNRTKEWVFCQFLERRGGVLNRLNMPDDCKPKGDYGHVQRLPNIIDYIRCNVDMKKLDTQDKIRKFLEEKNIQVTRYHEQQERDAEERLEVILEEAVVARESGKVQDNRKTFDMMGLGLDKPAPAGSMTPAPDPAAAGKEEAEKAAAALPPGITRKDIAKLAGAAKVMGIPEERINADFDAIIARPGVTGSMLKSDLQAKVNEYKALTIKDINSAANNEPPSLAMPPGK